MSPVTTMNLLSISQAVEFAREMGKPITRQGVKYWIEQGFIPATRIGHYWYVQQADLADRLARWTVPSPLVGRRRATNAGRRAAA